MSAAEPVGQSRGTGAVVTTLSLALPSSRVSIAPWSGLQRPGIEVTLTCPPRTARVKASPTRLAGRLTNWSPT
jgi:hypothetical protein